MAFLLSGVVFGLSAGIAPGPLLTLVISETLRYDLKAGIKVAIAPILSDVPIVVASLFVIQQIADVATVYGILSLLGSAFIGYLAVENFRTAHVTLALKQAEPQSIRKGIVTNVLNPHPYMFWLTIGAPTVLSAHQQSWMLSTLFITVFYLCLVGSKIMLAVLVARSRTFFQGRPYKITMQLLGIALLVFAILFVRDGLTYLGLNPLAP